MKMFVRKNIKVPQLRPYSCLYAVYLTYAILTMFSHKVLCSDSNSEPYHLNKKMPLSGSGHGAAASYSGNLQKRSSYAVISQAMSETIGDNEFGSE